MEKVSVFINSGDCCILNCIWLIAVSTVLILILVGIYKLIDKFMFYAYLGRFTKHQKKMIKCPHCKNTHPNSYVYCPMTAKKIKP